MFRAHWETGLRETRPVNTRNGPNVVLTNMRRWPNVGLLLGQRRRRWANSKTKLDQRLMFAGGRLYKCDYNHDIAHRQTSNQLHQMSLTMIRLRHLIRLATCFSV